MQCISDLLSRRHTFMRFGQLSAALSDETECAPDRVFDRLPTDRGHFSVPYLAHVLRGLRRQPPAYVTDLLEGRTPPTWVTEAVAGIVIISDPEPTNQLGQGRVLPFKNA